MIKIIVCDDERETSEKIRKLVYDISRKLKRNVEVYMYFTGKEVLDLICRKKAQFDLLLLDIDMPDISGLDVAKAVRDSGSEITLIFISSHEQYVFKSIEYRPFRYIRKNHISDELPHALKDAYTLLDSYNKKSITIKVSDEQIHLKHSDIMYCEIQNRKLNIHTNNGNVFALRSTIKDFSKKLEDNDFIQIHSGCIVNAKYIDKISNTNITLDNGEKLLVSRTRIKSVKSDLLEYWGTKI